MLDAILAPWPWWVGGPMLGLMVPILLILGNKEFGVSSSFRHICAATLKPGADYFKYKWKDSAWSLALVGGVVVGSGIAVLFLGGDSAPPLTSEAQSLFLSWGMQPAVSLQPPELFSVSQLLTAPALLSLIGGGFLVGFGTRYGNGCTSGHAIMGISLLNIGSIVATISFFVGGILVSNFVVPIVMSL